MNNKPKQYSCAQLGVCQSRPGSSGCSVCSRPSIHNTEDLPPGGFYFAPGTVEDCSATRARTRKTDTIARGLLAAAALAALAAAIGISAGWITVGALL